MATTDIALQPILAAETDEVARFLHSELNPAVSVEGWRALVAPPWGAEGPNRGFLLRDGERIVGVYAAVYSTRQTDAGTIAVCNLAAFCVLEDYRSHGLRLIRALLKQKDLVFTDLSPSGNVVAMNERLGFTRLDDSTRLGLNLPAIGGRGTVVTGDPERIEATLSGHDLRIYLDHRAAPAVRHLVVERDGRYAYLMFRADARKGLRLFATPLYAGGDTDLLRRAWGRVGAHLLTRHRLPVTLAERRVLGFAPRVGRELASPRAKMFRGAQLDESSVDYLYSELTLVAW